MAKFAAAEAFKNGVSFAAAMESVSSKERIIENSRRALEQLNLALEAVKQAPDNPYGTNDEEIAGVILKSLEDVEKKRRYGNKT